MQGILVFLIILFQRWPFLIILPLSNLLRHFESSFSEKKKSRNHYQQIIKTFFWPSKYNIERKTRPFS